MRRIAPLHRRRGIDAGRAPQPAAHPVHGALVLGVGLLTLVTAWAMTGPTAGDGIASGWTTPVVLVALVLVGGGTVLLIQGVDCRVQRLFRTRRLFAIGALLIVAGVGMTAACLSSGPFASILARGRADTADLHDACMLAAAFICMTGACVAFALAREARQHERHWLDVLRR